MNVMQQLITEHMDIWTAADTAKRSGRGRASSNAGSVYGVKKLRELILELAVRGKLVPQDANDEPASELLKRIQAEKAKLVAEGKIKKDKPLAPIAEDEKPFELPHSWEWVRIGSICHDWGQKTPDVDFTYIEVSAIDSLRGVISSPELVNPENAPSRARKIVKEGTVIYSTIRPYLLNIAVIEDDFQPEPIASTAFAIVHPFCLMPPRYFLSYFRSPVFVRFVESVQMGIAYPAINDGQFFSGLIALSPLAEQHRIVAKVDELMALCDQLEAQHSNAAAAHEKLVSHLLGTLTQSQTADDFSANWQRISAHFDTLFTTEASIDALKQTLLQLAVMGKLVPQDANDEPASELLKRIQAEKSKLVAEGKIKKDKPLAAIGDDEKPFELPQGWEWVQWIELTTINDAAFKRGPFGSSLRKDMFVSSGYKVYEQYCPINDDCSFERYFVTKEKFDSMKDFAVKAEDFLISCSGVTLGRITQIPEVFNEGIINQALLRVRMNREYVNSDFFKLLFRSPYFQKMIFENSTGSAIPNVKGVQDLKKMAVPFLPIAEQKRIVAKVNALMTLCDQLKSRITSANQQQQKLADVLVAQAVT
jgi:type I restriction enzyme S subunit